ncbi:MAG: cupredoxin family protein [Proteobacteria bacterium]|nr:cupredoxin family protein [Pseudomonadota bacterium]
MKLKYLVAVAAIIAGIPAAQAHDGEFSAGRPGDPKKPARTVTVTMHDDAIGMHYVPDRIEVKRGEQVRIVIENKGVLKHEFTLATMQDNKKHGALMMKFPDMEHDDPNAKSIEPGKSAEILWRFDKSGTFEFACLIPGHYEAGMHGTASVK